MAETVDSGTYTADTLKRKIALSLLNGSINNQEPVRHWAQALGNAAKAGLGGYLAYQAGEDEKADQKAQSEALKGILGGGAPSATPVPAATGSVPSSNPAASPMGALPGLDDAINASAAKYGIDPEYLRRTAQVESGGGRNLSNPMSSAKGPFQFIDSTAKQYGLTDPNDPVQSADAAARLALDNKNALTKTLGREPTPGELYLAHQQGAGGAAKLLQNPNQPAVGLLGQSAVINNGGSPAMTGAQFAQGFTRKFDDSAALPPNARPAGPANSSPVAQALSQQPSAPPMQAGGGDTRSAIVNMLNSPNPAVQKMGRALATGIIQKNIEGEKPTDLMRNVTAENADRKARGLPPLSPLQFETQVKEAGKPVTNINQQQESEFQKEAGKLTAKRYADMVDDIPQAKQMISDVQTLTDLGKQIGTGKEAQVKAALGPYAQALGFDVKDLGEIQAYEGIVNRLAPNLRVKGSGAQSDFELKNFLKSLPSLGNTPEGNELVSRVMNGMYQNKVKAGEIGSAVLNGDITRKEADKMIRELPDPMQEWRDYQKKAKPSTGGASVDDLLKKYGGK